MSILFAVKLSSGGDFAASREYKLPFMRPMTTWASRESILAW